MPHLKAERLIQLITESPSFRAELLACTDAEEKRLVLIRHGLDDISKNELEAILDHDQPLELDDSDLENVAGGLFNPNDAVVSHFVLLEIHSLLK